MELIDIGCNLAHDSFDEDREAVIDAARAVGVSQIVVTGASEGGSVKAAALAGTRPGRLFATAGVHPHLAREFSAETESVLAELHRQDEVVAVGECGLDYFRDFSPRPDQRRVFERQLELAVACGKPVFLHQRDAHERFLPMLREQRDALSGGVVHCFTDRKEALFAYLDLDMYIGITGWVCDERRGRELLQLVPHIPAERLLLETDAPYLLPRSLRPKPSGRRNEPAYLPEVLRVVAEARQVSPRTLAARTSENAARLFALSV